MSPTSKSKNSPFPVKKTPSTCRNSSLTHLPFVRGGTRWKSSQDENHVASRGLHGQLCTPRRGMNGPAVFQAVWLHYSCFERLKQIIKMSRATKTSTHKKSLVVLQREEALQLLWVSGGKRSITWGENPKKSCFLGELLPCSWPACQNSLYFSSFAGLLAEAHLCVVFPTVQKQLLSQGLRRPVWHVMLRAEQAGNPPGSGTLQPIHTNRPNLLHPCQPARAFIFLVASTISMLSND